MNKNETILLGAACFFAGAVSGFLIAPIKKGIYCGNNSGNNYADKNGDDNEEGGDEIDKVLDEVKSKYPNPLGYDDTFILALIFYLMA